VGREDETRRQRGAGPFRTANGHSRLMSTSKKNTFPPSHIPLLKKRKDDFKNKINIILSKLKIKISNNFKQNTDGTDETHSKQLKIHTSLWIFKISRKKSVNQKY
jgi:hypothetical protein